MSYVERGSQRERDLERNDGLIDRLDQLVANDHGLRHALPIAGKGMAELRGWLREMGRTDIWDSLENNTIGNRP